MNQIDFNTPNRHLDQFISHKINWGPKDGENFKKPSVEPQKRGDTLTTAPHFSSSMQDAWLLIDYIKKLGLGFEVMSDRQSKQIIVMIQDTKTRLKWHKIYAYTPCQTPLAICIATLMAIGVDIDMSKIQSPKCLGLYPHS